MSHDLKEMESGTALSRREFTLEAALAILAGCVITITDAACGSSNSTPTTPTAPPADINGVVAANHAQPHAVVITGAMITAGNAVTLNIQGQSTHNHTFAFSVNVQLFVLFPPLEQAPDQTTSRPFASLRVIDAPVGNVPDPLLPTVTLMPVGVDVIRSPLRPLAVTVSVAVPDDGGG